MPSFVATCHMRYAQVTPRVKNSSDVTAGRSNAGAASVSSFAFTREK